MTGIEIGLLVSGISAVVSELMPFIKNKKEKGILHEAEGIIHALFKIFKLWKKR